MMMNASTSMSPYLAGLGAAALVYLIGRNWTSKKRGPLPPGPRRLPVVGNFFDIPIDKEWLTYRTWSEKYGDLVYIEALGTKIVILGGEETLRDLAEKRVNWQFRPRSTMLNDLMDFDWLLSALPYGERWRRGRKLLHSHLHSSAVPAYQHIQLSSARSFVLDLLRTKHDKDVLLGMVRENFGASIIRMTYGIDVKNGEDEYIAVPETILHAISEVAVPGRFYVDLIPILKYVPMWFPGAEFQRHAVEIKAFHRRMRDRPFEVTQANMADGTALTSFVQRMLENTDASDLETEDLIKDLAGMVYLAGSDTTVATVISFFLAMVIHPEAQHRAQAELDTVVGRDRLPEFSDKKDLPYVNALMNECLRWLPVIPMGVPHLVLEDDEYNGYFIPKGTFVLMSQWAMLQDPERYPNPEQFMPERYLEQSPLGAWTTRTDVRNPRDFCFGFGRRICPGIHIAEQSLFATVATVLHTLSIGRSVDKHGVEIVPEPNVSSGLLCHPKPFEYTIRMRDDAADMVQLCAVS